MKFTDQVSLTGTQRTKDGYMIADIRCARTGIQQYLGVELGMPTTEVINVYRPESEVFNKDSLASYAHKPVTDDHPDEPVNAENWKTLAKGDIGGEVVRDGEYVRVPLKLMDAETIGKVDDGKVEVSMGYSADIELADGIAPDGTKYQAIQKNIRVNHLAIVDKGRAGHECRIGDKSINWGVSPTTTQVIGDSMTTQKVLVDGLTVETTEQGAVAIKKLQDDAKASAQLVQEAEEAKQKLIDAKDAEIAKKDAEIEKLKESQLTDSQIDEKVKARAKLLGDAQKVAKDAKFDGLSDKEVKLTAVKAVLGDEAVKDKTQAYIDARFDILLEDADKNQSNHSQHNPTDTALGNIADSRKNINDNGQSDYEKRLSEAWKGE